MRRPLVLFLSLILLWAVVAQANHLLAVVHLSLFAGGLFAVFAANDLSFADGFAAALLGGAICDANAPVPFGTQAFLFAGTYAVLFALGDRIPQEGTAQKVAIALLANLALFLVMSALHAGSSQPAAWPRLGVDLVCSQVFLLLASPWFLALQERVLPRAQAS